MKCAEQKASSSKASLPDSQLTPVKESEAEQMEQQDHNAGP